eukprot:6062787-Ditylum_brightwellii.AAC.1
MVVIKTLTELGADLQSVAKTNNGLLKAIELACSKETIISGYTYSLKYNLPSTHGTDQAWSFHTNQHTDSIARLLENWHHNGEPLKQPIDIFNDNINYTLETYTDVIRLNKKLFEVGYVAHIDFKPVLPSRFNQGSI